jgi:hypothetical protein
LRRARGHGEWRDSVAKEARIDPTGVVLVGSAATGYSLSPRKPARPFHRERTAAQEASDVDIGLVNEGLFIAAWNEVVRLDRARALSVSWTTISTMREQVYFGAMADFHLPPGSDPRQRLLLATAASTRRPPLLGLKARCRIYRRPEDLKAYHVQSLRKLRLELTGS